MIEPITTPPVPPTPPVCICRDVYYDGIPIRRISLDCPVHTHTPTTEAA
jgi:hypothetical protein